MKIEVICPRCKTAVRCDPALLGKRLPCPKCDTALTVRPAPPAEAPVLDALPVEEEVAEALPAEAEEVAEALPVEEELGPGRPISPARAGRRFARAAGIDPDEPAEQEVMDEGDADRQRQIRKAKLPEVSSAYRPSGALPAGALGSLALGALLGAPAALLAEAVAGAVAGAVLGLLYVLNVAAAVLGVVYCLAVVLLAVAALAALVAPFAAGGWAAARVTAGLGRMGNNRNARAAAVLAALSAGLSVAAAAALFVAFGKGPLDERGLFGTRPGGLDVVYLIVGAVGAVVAMAVAWYVAAERVREAKFCEGCGQFMGEVEIKRLCLGGVWAVVRALAEKNTTAAAGLLHSADGQDGKVMLFTCPVCGKAYVEVTALFKARWREKKKQQETEDSWRVASVELTAEEADLFRSAARGEDD
jgi:hypothetical protein